MKDQKIVAFFPDSPRHLTRAGVQEIGHILQVQGEMIVMDFKECDSRDTDDYQLETDDFPTSKGIYVFEGEGFAKSEWDQPRYEGTWRKATAADLEGLIE